MLSVLAAVLPIFALILAGCLARRGALLGEHATRELNRFVVWLALPALLFDIVAKARWADIWQPGFIGAFGIGAGAVMALVVVTSLRMGRPLGDAAIDGLNGAYANTAFLGFPLMVAAFGPQALAPSLTASILTVCVAFAVALALIEIGRQAGAGIGRATVTVTLSLARNPLVFAPAAGAVFLGFGIAVPGPVDRFLTLLGGAASPCALVALGLFLAQRREGPRPGNGMTAWLTGLKLIGQPLVTFVLARWVFGLSPDMTHMAVLLAALPTGTGPFMLAEFYGREAALTARVVLITTILSIATVTLYLAYAV